MLRAKEFQVEKLLHLPVHVWQLFQIAHLLASYAILEDTTEILPQLNSFSHLHGPPVSRPVVDLPSTTHYCASRFWHYSALLKDDHLECAVLFLSLIHI